MRSRATCVLALAAAFAAQLAPAQANGDPSPGDEACVERAVAAIQRRYEGIRDLRARFRQTTRSVALGGAGGGPVQTSTGTVQFAKPGRMRWSYEEPEASLVVSDGRTLWIFDPARREAQRMGVGEGYLSGAAIQFLLGEGDVLAEFRVTADACAESSVELTLVPRAPASYERLQIRADPASGDVLATRIVDLLGNQTEVVFRDLEANLDPPASAFRFDPPADVRVIDLEALAPGGEPRR